MFKTASCPSVQMEMKGKRKSYNGLFKAKIVSELINKKRNLKELAEYYDVHPNQIKNWKSILLKEASRVFDDKRRTTSPAGKLRKHHATPENKSVDAQRA